MTSLASLRAAPTHARDIVSAAPEFSVLPELARRRLTSAAVLQRWRRRERFALKDALLVVGSGRLRERRGNDDRELTLTYAGPGDLVGEASFLGGTPTLDFVGVESGEGARVLASVVRDVMRSAPDLAIAFAARIERRRQNVEERLHALLTRTVEHRVLSFIAEAAVREGIPTPEGVRLAVRYTHLEIARYVGSTRETVTLVLGELRRKGLVAIQQRWLIVPDVGRLEATLDAGG